MMFQKTEIESLYVIHPKVHGDDRGYFFESYKQTSINEQGINFYPVQDNESYSKSKGTLRGFHLQHEPFAQAKLVRCIRGKILDVALDLRKNSTTFGKYFAVELSGDNKLQLFIPKGFAHAFLTLEEECIVAYKVDNYYSKEHDVSIAWNDDSIAFPWGISNPILSEKDKNAMSLKDFIKMI